jgi:flagellar biogenesis protein FliO
MAAEAARLPLRTDDPVSLALITKVMLVTALLLALVYLLLRWYAKRGNLAGSSSQAAQLQCAASLRLSGRTKVYLLKTPSAELLVAESLTGTTVTLLPASPAAAEGPAASLTEQP